MAFNILKDNIFSYILFIFLVDLTKHAAEIIRDRNLHPFWFKGKSTTKLHYASSNAQKSFVIPFEGFEFKRF